MISYLLCYEMKLHKTSKNKFHMFCDNFAGFSERKEKKTWEDSIKMWTGVDFAKTYEAAKDVTRWKGFVEKPSLVPQ